jgi:hypothetical protein
MSWFVHLEILERTVLRSFHPQDVKESDQKTATRGSSGTDVPEEQLNQGQHDELFQDFQREKRIIHGLTETF